MPANGGNDDDEDTGRDRSRSNRDNNGGGSSSGGIDVAQAIERISARYGNDVAAVTEMAARERARKESEIRDLKRRLRAARVPEGGVVLSADEAKVWEKVKALGEPDAIAKKIADGAEAIQRLASIEREREDAEVAELAGYNAAVLTRLRESEGFAVEVRTVKQDGKTVRVPYARKTGSDGKPTGDAVPLTEYAEEHLTLFMPALAAVSDGSANGDSSTASGTTSAASGSTTGTGTTQQTGAPRKFPATSGTANKKGQPSVFDRIRAEREAERKAAQEQTKGVEERLGMLRQT